MKRGSSSGRAYVVGAGLAGLAAAVELAAAGREVRLYEASGHAGGRCRSYFDAELGCRLDNGNHLLLSGNRRALRYLEQIDALATIEGPDDASFAFFETATRRRWVLRPNRGRLPWWISRRARRVPGTAAVDYLEARALRCAAPTATVGETLDPRRPLFARLWEPLAVAALNTGVEEASALLFWQILGQTLGRGGAACRPLVPRDGLSETFVDPALETLRRHDARLHFGARLRAIDFTGNRATALAFDTGSVELGGDDDVILATPAAMAARLVPGLVVPDLYSPVVNAHFRCTPPPESPLFVGVIGGAAQWIFRKREVLSVTVSAAQPIVERPAEELSESLWRDVAAAYSIPVVPLPRARVVKERRATFLATPEQLLRRPAAATQWRNLMLAGDYTDTGLPATIEGAVASGFAAARLVLDCGRRRPFPMKRDDRPFPAATSPNARRQRQLDFR
jgi:squalene-associated FAD-dependent desaturase